MVSRRSWGCKWRRGRAVPCAWRNSIGWRRTRVAREAYLCGGGCSSVWPTVLAAASRGALLGVFVADKMSADKMSATTTRPESGLPVTIDCMFTESPCC